MGILFHFQQLCIHFLRSLRYLKLTEQLIHHLRVPTNSILQYDLEYNMMQISTRLSSMGKK